MRVSIDEINRSINVALRSANTVAVQLSGSKVEGRTEGVEKVAAALELLSDVQKMIYRTRPDLEYHYEEGREPTEFMLQFQSHLKNAKKLEATGNVNSALEELRLALSMEPPPLPHEALVKEIKRIARSAS